MENWRAIKNFEEYYVSDLGRVKSKKGRKEIILKTYLAGKLLLPGKVYKTVYLYKDGVRKPYKVSVLVAIAFLDHVPDGTHKIVVDHIDNDKLNDKLNNLQLLSNRENSSKNIRTGTSKFVGVYWYKPLKVWRAAIHYDHITIALGHYLNEEDAANCYLRALEKIKIGITPTSEKFNNSSDKIRKRGDSSSRRKDLTK